MRIPVLFLIPTLLGAASTEALSVRLDRAFRLSKDEVRQLQGELAMDKGLSESARAYYDALLNLTLVQRAPKSEAKSSEATVDRFIKLLEGRKDAEIMALLGAFYGQKMGFSPMSGMSLSPKASSLFQEALKLSPENPRVLMHQGINVFFTPKFFGGGAVKAQPILERALNAAEKETTSSPAWAPRWGKAETRVWLAQVEADLGKLEEARKHCQEALALDPSYGHARMILHSKLQSTRP